MPENGKKPQYSATTSRPSSTAYLRLDSATEQTQPKPVVDPQLRAVVNLRSRPTPNSQRSDRTSGNFTKNSSHPRATTKSQLHSSVNSWLRPVAASKPALDHPPGTSTSNSPRSVVNQPTTRTGSRRNDKDRATGGAFNNARNFVLNQPTFIEGAHPNEKDSIALLARYTIPGAQFDSGERYPPPSCHPGTRLDISGKLISWMGDLRRAHKVVWLHGPAGVGKSAVIQTLAESEADSSTSILGATLFFSRPNERDNPQRVVLTIAYQLAVKYPAYRMYVTELLGLDPQVVEKSLVEQFKRLIVKPFAEERLLEGSNKTVLITLDGLDECSGESAQREIISLISKFCLLYKTTPLIWIITSRPEPQIRTAFSQRDVQGAYMEVDMPVDSDQACADVEHFLRDKFTEIKENYSTSFSPSQQWPTETDFTEIARRSSGLFAFANTVVRFTDDAECANPVAQLQKVLAALDSILPSATQDSPFAALDRLYALVMSAIPTSVLPTTRRLLMARQIQRPLVFICDVLSINQADTYSALRKLHSVLDIPSPEEAYTRNIRPFHASFDDYLKSSFRSGPFFIDPFEIRGDLLSASVRILLESHNTIESIIDTSTIHTSWLTEDMGKQQITLFYKSLDVVLGASLEEVKGFDGLRSFFQDINYAAFGSLFSAGDDIAYILAGFLGSPFLLNLHEWGVITPASIGSLDLNSMSLDNPVYIYCDSPSLSGWDHKMVSAWEKGYPPRNPKKFVLPGVGDPNYLRRPQLASDRHKWSRATITLRHEPHWHELVQQHLSGLSPSHKVTILGRGDRKCILVDIDGPPQSWSFILPYTPS